MARDTMKATELTAPPSVSARRWRRIQEAVKRMMDIVIALLALVLLSPLLLALSGIILLDSPGPVLFKQKRIGKQGGSFTFYKFRSMFNDVDDSLHREAIRSFAMGKAWDVKDGRPIFKPDSDDRVTRVGRLLRATSLDELPQIINVLMGQMSIVGPRPAIPYELEFYDSWHHERFSMRPGMTGVWQVEGRSHVTFAEMVRMDIQYVRSFSLWMDISLILRTVPVVLLGKGGY